MGSSMRIIPSSHKQARLWVDACTASLEIDKAAAAAMYANLCGFPSWNSIVQIIGTQQPSAPDEALSHQELQERFRHYEGVLGELFKMPPSFAKALINKLSPSSSQHPKKFTLEQDSRFREDEIFGDIPEDMDEFMEEFINMFKEINPEMADLDTTNFAERMRISKPMDPGLYYDFCLNHGWDLDEASYAEEYVYGQRSFKVKSPHGDVHVYITSLVKTPGDNDDEMAEHVKELFLNDAINYDDDPSIIIFWGNILTKDIAGKRYTSVGTMYVDDDWQDVLMNAEMTSVDKLIDMACEGIDFDNPDPAFEDINHQTLQTFLALTVGAENSNELSKYNISGLRFASGWSMPMIEGK